MLFLEQHLAHLGHHACLACGPGEADAVGQHQRAGGRHQGLGAPHPLHIDGGRVRQRDRLRGMGDDMHPGIRRQFLDAAADGREGRGIAHQQVPVVVHRNHHRAARPADDHGLPGRRLQRPRTGGPIRVEHEIDHQFAALAIEAARRVVAPDGLGVGTGRRQDELHVIVE